MTQVRKILVVRLGAMGDIIHALPAVARLRRSFPGVHISWAVESQWMPLLENNPDVDAVIDIPLSRWWKHPISLSIWRSLYGVSCRLRQSQFDLAIDFQGLLKSAAVTYCSHADRIFGFDRETVRERLSASFYSDQVAPHSKHVVDQNLDLTTAVGAKNGPLIFSLPLGEISPLLPEGEFVLAAPLAGWVSKQWPSEYYTELAKLMWSDRGMPLVLDCAPQNSTYVEQICAGTPDGSCVVHSSSLLELIAATRRAKAVVGVDSGPLHVAAALDVPGVAIYGQTDPARNGPYGNSFRVLRDSEVVTSYKRGTNIHPSMLRIRPDQVWESLASVLDVTNTDGCCNSVRSSGEKK